jgi:large subunit ribosomal protein L19
MDIIKTIEETQKRPGAQGFNVGDTVKVYFKIIEGKTERIQVYEGIVLCKKNSGASETFTVRKISYGVGVERVFPVYSPRVVNVEIVRPGKVRRSKLYYVREKIGKAAKVKELIGQPAVDYLKWSRDLSKAAAEKEAALKAEVKAEEAAEHNAAADK